MASCSPLVPIVLLALASAVGCRDRASDQPPSVSDSLARVGLDSIIGSTFERLATDSETELDMREWIEFQRGDFTTLVWGIGQHLLNRRRYLALQKVTQWNGRQPVWKVVDAIWVPVGPDSLSLVNFCAVGRDLFDATVVALAFPPQRGLYTRVFAAWRADTIAGHFTVVPRAIVRCAQESVD